MGTQKHVLVDTCFLVDALRNNKQAEKILSGFEAGSLSISEITLFELLIGCNTIEKRHEVEDKLKSYNLIQIDRTILDKTKSFIVRYNRLAIEKNKPLQIPDTMIAASAALYNIPVLTSNKRDFLIFKEITLHHLSRNLK